MSRAHRERRLEGESSWPNLVAWLGEFFGSGIFRNFDNLTEAKAAAVSSRSFQEQKQLAREWWEWNLTFGRRSAWVDYLDAYGVDVHFDSEAETRAFMNDLYDQLIVEIRKVEEGWKP